MDQNSEDNAPDFVRQLAEEHASVLAGLSAETIVITREGETPVDWLAVGDEVLTRDRGYEPIIWINRTKLNRDDLRITPEFGPVTITAGTVDASTPETDVTVSPRQLILVRAARAEIEYGSHEVLVPAASIAPRADPENMHWNAQVSYAQILLASHQMLIVDRLWVGSLFTGSLATDLHAERCPLYAKLSAPHMMACRPILSEEEGRVLMHDIWAERAASEEDEAQSKAG